MHTIFINTHNGVHTLSQFVVIQQIAFLIKHFTVYCCFPTSLQPFAIQIQNFNILTCLIIYATHLTKLIVQEFFSTILLQWRYPQDICAFCLVAMKKRFTLFLLHFFRLSFSSSERRQESNKLAYSPAIARSKSFG